MDAPLSSARHNQEPQQHEKRREKEERMRQRITELEEALLVPDLD